MFLKKLWRCLCRHCRPAYRRRRRGRPIPHQPDPSYVVARFRRPIVSTEADIDFKKAWEALRRKHPGIRLLSMFRSLDNQKTRPAGTAAQGPSLRAPEFEKYGQVIGRPDTKFSELAADLVRDLAAFVESAYAVRPGPLPQVNTSDPGFPEQFHLHPRPDPLGWAPGGVGAEAAWLRPGSDGTGDGANRVKVVDLEKGWEFGHTELPPAQWLRGQNDAASHAHGTAVLGLVCGRDGNQLCGVGLAPRADPAVSSYWEQLPDPENPGSTRVVINYDDAILAAVNPNGGFLKRGDVLLIEAQAYATDAAADNLLLPIEVFDLTFNLLSWAVNDLGIIVVAAGGDGTNMQFPPLNMDTWTHPVTGAQLFLRATRDSGAILVSAAQPSWFDPMDIQPPPWAPVGMRIDCFAWGDGVYTCWPATATSPCQDGSGAGEPFTYCFSGTSAAAAIIAGAAIVLQGIYRHATGGNSIPPPDMRARLSNQAVNTPPSFDSVGNRHRIGMMPDLAALAPQIP